MANSTNHHPDLESIRDLLSPYLDGEVSDDERTLVEQAIATSTELRYELETMRQTVTMVAALPPVPAPRPFTLSEADVQSVSPAPKRFFSLPSWAGGLAMVAATLVCVLIAGGVFLTTRFGPGFDAMAPAEIAKVERDAAPQAAEAESAVAPTEPAAEQRVEEAVGEIIVEKEAEKEAPALALEEPVEEEVAEEKIVEKVAEEEKEASAPALEEEPAPTEPEDKEEITITEAEEDSAAETADDTPMAGQVEMAESQDVTEGVAGAGTPHADELAATIVPPAPQAPAGGEDTAASAPEAVPETEKEAAAAAEAPLATAQPTPSPAAKPQDEESLALRSVITPRPVEIQNQTLQVKPGLIQLEGFIEAKPGTPLIASLQRNQRPFDNWADPASLQSVVQANGQVTFAIRPKADQTNEDLFAIGPANYQVIIISTGVDTPVIATVFFDTFDSLGVSEQATATTTPTPTPKPTSTPIAQVTVVPPATPTVMAKVTKTSTPTSISSSRSILLIVGMIFTALVALVIVGFIIWSKVNNKKL